MIKRKNCGDYFLFYHFLLTDIIPIMYICLLLVFLSGKRKILLYNMIQTKETATRKRVRSGDGFSLTDGFSVGLFLHEISKNRLQNRLL